MLAHGCAESRVYSPVFQRGGKVFRFFACTCFRYVVGFLGRDSLPDLCCFSCNFGFRVMRVTLSTQFDRFDQLESRGLVGWLTSLLSCSIIDAMTNQQVLRRCTHGPIM